MTYELAGGNHTWKINALFRFFQLENGYQPVQ